MKKSQTVPDNVLTMLDNLTVEDNVAKKYPYPLSREDYVALNKVLTALGGKWIGKKIQGHVLYH